MDKDQERKAFEDAITIEGLYVNLSKIGPASSDAGEYADIIVQTCWQVWQLAIAYRDGQNSVKPNEKISKEGK